MIWPMCVTINNVIVAHCTYDYIDRMWMMTGGLLVLLAVALVLARLDLHDPSVAVEGMVVQRVWLEWPRRQLAAVEHLERRTS